MKGARRIPKGGTASIGQKGMGAWISAVPHRLNGTELYWEELQDDICLRYGLMPQDIPATCNGCGKRFLIYNAIS